MKEEMFSEYEIEEKKNIQQQIENYVHAQIYNKIFSKDNLEEDNDIYKTCEKNNMIKASDINKEINYDDEKMIQIMIYFVNNMENEMSPANKIHEFEIIDMIINNIINIYGYNEKFYDDLLFFVFIKAKPKLLYSTLKYINMYLDNDLKNKNEDLINKLTTLVKSLSEFKTEEKKTEDNLIVHYF